MKPDDKLSKFRRKASVPSGFLWWVFRHSAVGEEDTFTECFAEALRQDLRLAGRIVAFLRGESVEPEAPIPLVKDIRTQVSFPHHSSRLDLLIEIDTGDNLAVEVKLAAPETNEQVQRYLAIPVISKVCMVSGRWEELLEPTNPACSHPNYLRPADRPNFRWHDIYPVIAGRTQEPDVPPLTQSLLSLFVSLGFHPIIDKEGRWGEICREAEPYRIWFLSLLKSALDGAGWKTNFDQYKREVYGKGAGVGRLRLVYINNWSNPGELNVGFDFPLGTDTEALKKLIEESPLLPTELLRVVLDRRKKGGDIKTLDVFIAHRHLYDGKETDELRREAMRDFVMRLHSMLV